MTLIENRDGENGGLASAALSLAGSPLALVSYYADLVSLMAEVVQLGVQLAQLVQEGLLVFKVLKVLITKSCT